MQVPGSGSGKILQLNANTDWTGGTITIGSTVIVNNAEGKTFRFEPATTLGVPGSQFNNSGLVVRSGQAGTARIDGSFTNNSTGTVHVRTGILRLGSTLTNFSSGTLTGGSYVAAAELRLPSGNNVVSNAARIVLEGAGSSITSGTSSGTDALTGFTTNLAGGTFELIDDRDFGTLGGFSNQGSVKIGADSTLSTGTGGNYTQSGGTTELLFTFSTLDPAGFVDLQGGTLSGVGIVAGNVTNAATVAPGNSPGTLTIQGDYNQTSTGDLAIEIQGTSPSQYDRLVVTGAVQLEGNLVVSLTGTPPSVGSSFTILEKQSAGDYNTTFEGLPEGAEFDVGSTRFSITYKGGSGSNDVVLTVVPGVVALTTPTLSINDVTHTEGDSGTTDYTFTVTLSEASASSVTVNYQTADASAKGLAVNQLVTGLSRPVFLTTPPGEVDRLFILEQHLGRIRIFDRTTSTLLPTPFLTIPGGVNQANEEGLLGLAFHPNYAANGFFYVFYTNTSGNLQISRFTRDGADDDLADPASVQPVLTIPHPGESNHNGGWLGFGPDGYLYVSTGDGGGGNDPPNNAQNKDVLLGKILRLNVNGDDFVDASKNYAIPADNPFAGATAGADEVWAYGLRNPFRPSFDRETGDLWIADVGQNAREEIDFQPAGSSGGENYGWKQREGTLGTKPPGAIDPIYDYPHDDGNPAEFEGNVVTGGYVYRGPIQELVGQYFFADAGSDGIWSLRFAGGDPASFNGTQYSHRTDWTSLFNPTSGGPTITSIGSFGEDAAGNLFILDLFGGEIFAVTNGGDYDPASGQLIFAPGQTEKTITVKVIGDLLDEAAETFQVNLSAPVNATLADGQGIGTLANDDFLSFSIDDVTKFESDVGINRYEFTVTLSGNPTDLVSVQVSTADGTALAANDDYEPLGANFVLTFFPDDSLSQTVTVHVNGDGAVEADEEFFVNLSNATGALINDGQGVGTIQNDDGICSTVVTTIADVVDENDAVTSLREAIECANAVPNFDRDNDFDIELDNITFDIPNMPTDASAWFKAQNNLDDSTGPNDGGTFIGTAAYVDGKVGRAFDLDGLSYITVPDSPSLRPTSLTIDGWFRFESLGTQVLVSKTAGTGTSDSFAIFYLNGALWACVGDASGVGEAISVPFAPGPGFHHIAYTFDDAGDWQELYIDGQLMAAGDATKSIGYDTHPFIIGGEIESEVPSFFFSGQIDEVSLYPRVLSGPEVYAIYNAGGTGKVLEPLHAETWYRAEDNPTDAAGVHHATLVNGAGFADGQVGRGFNFDGVDDRVVAATSPVLRSATIETWFKPTSLANSPFLFERGTNEDGRLAVQIVPDNPETEFDWDVLNVFIGNEEFSFQVFEDLITENQFNHVSWLIYGDGEGFTDFQLFVNGTFAGVGSVDFNLSELPAPLTLGGSPTDLFAHSFQGVIDEFRIYDRTLSFGEMSGNYQAGLAHKAATGLMTIQPTSALPFITDGVVIDGLTQPGSEEFSGEVGGTLRIEINGALAGAGADGLRLIGGSDGSTIQGLVINGFQGDPGVFPRTGGSGLFVTSSNNSIFRNIVGTNATGTAAIPNLNGIEILAEFEGGGSNNRVERNLVSGNGGLIVPVLATAMPWLWEDGGLNTDFQFGFQDGFQDGTPPTIVADIGGVPLVAGQFLSIAYASGLTDAFNDTPSVNAQGYDFFPPVNDEAGSEGFFPSLHVDSAQYPAYLNQLVGVFTTATGAIVGEPFMLGNGPFIKEVPVGAARLQLGVNDDTFIFNQGSLNIIVTPWGLDVNHGNGVFIHGTSSTASGNAVRKNYIGTDLTGQQAIGNVHDGVAIFEDADGNVVGGGGEIDGRNVISGNGAHGVDIAFGASNNTIDNNLIGTNISGDLALGNGRVGVLMNLGAVGNWVIGNTISANWGSGVVINDVNSFDNRVEGNTIGMDSGGNGPLGNRGEGVEIAGGTHDNLIRNNAISGNFFDGIGIFTGSDDNVFQGNKIGTDWGGNFAVPNGGNGIVINGFGGDTTGNIIGGVNPGEGNQISGNNVQGIVLLGGGISGTIIQGNLIGVGIDFVEGQQVLTPLGNGGNGIFIGAGASDNLIGGSHPGAKNTIAHNLQGGIAVVDASTGNRIQRNSIYSNAGLGIDLGDDGPTLNDGQEDDSDPNRFYDFPILMTASLVGDSLVVSGFSRPGATIELFVALPDPSGFGEGKSFLISRVEGSADDSDNGTGTYGPGSVNGHLQGSDTTNRFHFTIPVASLAAPVGDDSFLTATATDTDGNTSEYSGLLAVSIPFFSIDDVQIVEGNDGTKVATFNVTLSRDPAQAVSVTVQTADDSATTADLDYNALAPTVITFSPGDPLTKTVEVTIRGDGKFELDESFFVRLTNPTGGAQIARSEGRGTITNDDTQPTISISAPTSVEEGDSGQTTLTYEVVLSNPSYQQVQANIVPLSLAAQLGEDFIVLGSSQIFFAPGAVGPLTITVQVLGDNKFELDEDFAIKLENILFASPGVIQATTTILDDDPQPTIHISGPVSVNEGPLGSFFDIFYDVSLSNPSYQQIQTEIVALDLVSTPGLTALLGNDFQLLAPTTLTFVPGSTLPGTIGVQQVRVRILGDNKFEPNETFRIKLQNFGPNVLAGVTEQTTTILNDDAPPTLTVTGGSVQEGNTDADNRVVPFTLTLSSASDVDVNGTFSLASISAQLGVDFLNPASLNFLIPAGTQEITINVPVVEEITFEPNETFTLTATVSNPATITAAGSTLTGTGTIQNDDVRPTVSLIPIAVIPEGNSSFVERQIEVRLSHGSFEPIPIELVALNLTAVAPADYNFPAPNTVTFDPGGSLVQIVTVRINGDTLFERDEQFRLQIQPTALATIGTGQIDITIQDDDTAPTLTVTGGSVLEGNVTADNRVVSFTLALSAVSGVDVTGTFSLTSGSATLGDDFENPASLNFTIPAGSTEFTVNVPIIEDTDIEPNESFTLTATVTDPSTVSNPGGTAQGAGTITNDDFACGLVVTTTADSGPGSLREAINCANSDPDLDTITFNIAGGGVKTISPTSALPTITAPVIIDGYTQPGASANTMAVGSDAVLLVELNGANAGPAIGLHVSAGNSTVRGLVINGFLHASGDQTALGSPIALSGGSGNRIEGNFLNTDPTGTLARPSSDQAIAIQSGSNNNTIGGATPQTRNVISGGTLGFFIATSGNVVQGNLIGTQIDGVSPLGNDIGVAFVGVSNNNTVTENVIAFNTSTGIFQGSGTGNSFLGNRIHSNGRLGIDLGGGTGETAADVTPNDLGDADTGANNLYNFPVLEAANVTAGNLILSGFARPGAAIELFIADPDPTGFGEGRTYLATFVEGSAGDADATTGTYGPGPINGLIQGTDTTNRFRFTIPLASLPAAVAVGTVLTSTATDAAGNTSEFSGNATVAIPSFSINDVQVTEGDAGTVNATFTLTMTNAPAQPVSVTLDTADGTATLADLDYNALTGVVRTFNPGEPLTQTFTVTVRGDTKFEADQTFVVNLTNATGGAVIGDSQGVGTIVNDDLRPTITIAPASASEGDPLTFNLSLSNASDEIVTVLATVNDGTATTADNDYTDINGQLITFAAGVTAAQFTVQTIEDTKFEADQTVTVVLSDADNASGTAGSPATGTIVNDDVRPTITIASASASEGDLLVFNLSLSNLSDEVVTVQATTADGTATAADNDYTPLAAETVTFAAGASTATLQVQSIEDTKFEANQTFTVTLAGGGNYAGISGSPATGTITNDDVRPTVTIAPTSASEGDALIFELTLSNLSDEIVSVLATTADGTATTANNDYSPLTNQAINFAPGTGTATLSVQSIEDANIEPTETFTITLAPTATAGGIAGSPATGTITNDDFAAPTFSINDVQVTEGNSGTILATFTVTLTNNPLSGPVSVTVNTADNTATEADNDYEPLPLNATVLTFATAGTQTVSVVVNGDTKFEAAESFFVNLSNSTGGAAIGDAQGIGTITNDDPPPTLTVIGGSSIEGNVAADDRKVPFTLQLSAPSGVAITGTLQTISGDGSGALEIYAEEGEDFISLDGAPFSIPAGVTEITVLVSVREDGAYGADERLTLRATPTDSSTISNNPAFASGVGTILNDDALPTVTVSQPSVAEGSNLVFQFQASHAHEFPVIYFFEILDGTATVADNDYTLNGQSVFFEFLVEFNALTGESTTSAELILPTLQDAKFEPDETVLVAQTGSVAINGIDYAQPVPLEAVGTILNNDPAPTLTVTGGSVLEGNPGQDSFVPFTLSLSAISGVDVSGTISLTSGTAQLDVDFLNPANLSFTIPAGAQQFTINVPVIEELLVELDESFTLTATASDSTTISNASAAAQGAGTIRNDDQATIAISDVTQHETNSGQTAFVFSVTLSQQVDVTVSAEANTVDGTATTANSDYQPVVGQTVTFPPAAGPGPQVQTVTVLVNGDPAVEPDEIFDLVLSNLSASGRSVTFAGGESPSAGIQVLSQFNPSNAGGLCGLAYDHTAGEIWVYDCSAADVQRYSPAGVFLSSIPRPGESADDVDLEIAPEALTLGATSLPAGTLLFINGESGTADIYALDKTTGAILATLNTAFGVSHVVGGSYHPLRNTFFLVQDRVPGAADENRIAEIDAITGAVLNSFAIGSVYQVNFGDIEVSASTGNLLVVSEFETRMAEFTPAGAFVGYHNLPAGLGDLSGIGLDDARAEAWVGDTAGVVRRLGGLPTAAVGRGTIQNDDFLAPTFSINDVTLTEGNAGTTTATFTVTLSNAPSGSVSVTVNTADSTATDADNDYEPLPLDATVLTFTAAGTQTVSVIVNGDTKFEANQTFFLNLSNATGGAVIGDSQGVGTITNDDVRPTISIAPASASEGDQLVFNLSLSNLTDEVVTVLATTSDDTATTADNDYTPVAGQTVTFAAGTIAATLSVQSLEDTIFEANQTFTVALTNAASASGVAGSPATGTINNDDVRPTITIAAASASEGDTVVFNLTLSNLSDEVVTVEATTADGTATTADNDYTPLSGQTVTFAARASGGTLNVQSIEDTKFEANQTFTVALAGGGNYTGISGSPATGTIINDDVRPTVTISPASASEGDQLIFDLSLSNLSDEIVSVLATTADGTATTANNDYAPLTSQAVNFAPGTSTTTLSVQSIEDANIEPAETFTVILAPTATAGGVAGSPATGTITNDDFAAPTFSINDVSLTEGNNGTILATFTVTLTNNPLTGPVSVTINTADNTATDADNDYEPLPLDATVLTFNSAGAQQVSVTINGDAKFELSESFFVNLSNATGGAVIGDGQGLGTIQNDDARPTISISGPPTAIEGPPASFFDVFFEVSLSNPSFEPIETELVALDLVSVPALTARLGEDFEFLGPTTLIFTPGSTSPQQVGVRILGDNKFEPDENFRLELRNFGPEADAGTTESTTTILNDDSRPTISISGPPTAIEGPPASFLDLFFEVSLSNPSFEPIETELVALDLVSVPALTARLGEDFEFLGPTTLIFTPGSTSPQQVGVRILGDNKFEPDETFRLELRNFGPEAEAGTTESTTTILNDDNAPVFSIDDLSLTEGNSGTKLFTFTVTLTGPTALPASVQVQSQNGTAAAGEDYVGLELTTLDFPIGTTSRQISITVNGDTTFEAAETFFVNLLNPTGATLAAGDASIGLGTIENDDSSGPPPLQPTIVKDDGDSVYRERGLWTSGTGGYLGDFRRVAAGTGTNTATWKLSVAPGTYEIFATWPVVAGAASNAPFTVFDGAVAERTAVVNQQIIAGPHPYDGKTWQSLGTVEVSSTLIVIQLSNAANGIVVADGVLAVLNPGGGESASLVAAPAPEGPDDLGSLDPLVSLDVTGDGLIAPMDALAVINQINAGVLLGIGPSGLGGDASIDVNADNYISPLDALLIINHINAKSAALPADSDAADAYFAEVGEGEANVWELLEPLESSLGKRNRRR